MNTNYHDPKDLQALRELVGKVQSLRGVWKRSRFDEKTIYVRINSGILYRYVDVGRGSLEKVEMKEVDHELMEWLVERGMVDVKKEKD